jgi:hypothetical protein
MNSLPLPWVFLKDGISVEITHAALWEKHFPILSSPGELPTSRDPSLPSAALPTELMFSWCWYLSTVVGLVHVKAVDVAPPQPSVPYQTF